MTRSGRWWPYAIVGVFVANAAVMGWVMVTAHSDHSFAIEEDYYNKALHWDESARRRDASAALGWDARGSVGADNRTVTVRIVDGDGSPINGASVIARAFHRSYPSEAVTVGLHEPEPGSYAFALAGARPGWWSIAIDAARGDDRYHTVILVEVPQGR